MHIPWQQAEIFIAVAETGSFSGAARLLRLTQPTVSRRVALLEQELGRPLFRRDSDGAHLTVEGEKLLPAAQQMARWASEMGHLASAWEDAPEGVVRCAVPPGIAFELMLGVARRARERYPGIRLELLAGIEHIDLTRGDAELSIRTRYPTQPELVVLRGYSSPIGVLCSPEFASGLPPGPVDPSDLPWITWSYPLEHVEPRPYLESVLDPFRIALASNDYLVQRRAVDESLGVFVGSEAAFDARAWGPLVRVDTRLALPAEASMYLVCARTMRHVPRVRAVCDLIDEIARQVEGLRVRRGEPD